MKRKRGGVFSQDIFGGRALKNEGVPLESGQRAAGTHAKRKRPIENGEWLHVCLKSNIARGRLSMRRPKVKLKIERIVKRTSEQAGVRVSKWANVGNHLHFFGACSKS